MAKILVSTEFLPLCPCEDVSEVHLEVKEAEKASEAPEEVKQEKKSIWEAVLKESAERDALYLEWLKEKSKDEPSDSVGPSVQYLNSEIFPILLPAMEEMLRKAQRWDALRVQKCRFDGLDFLAEYLWNKNPRRSGRNTEWLEAFDIPRFKLYLRQNPRPIFPKSWLWSREEAASHIQRWVRGWLVRKREDIQELRQFWKVIDAADAALKKTKLSTDSLIPNDSPLPNKQSTQ